MGFDKHGRYYGINIERYMTSTELRDWNKQRQHGAGAILGAIVAALLFIVGGRRH